MFSSNQRHTSCFVLRYMMLAYVVLCCLICLILSYVVSCPQTCVGHACFVSAYVVLSCLVLSHVVLFSYVVLYCFVFSSSCWTHVLDFALSCLMVSSVVVCYPMLSYVVLHYQTVVGHTCYGLFWLVLCCPSLF